MNIPEVNTLHNSSWIWSTMEMCFGTRTKTPTRKLYSARKIKILTMGKAQGSDLCFFCFFNQITSSCKTHTFSESKTRNPRWKSSHVSAILLNAWFAQTRMHYSPNSTQGTESVHSLTSLFPAAFSQMFQRLRTSIPFPNLEKVQGFSSWTMS